MGRLSILTGSSPSAVRRHQMETALKQVGYLTLLAMGGFVIAIGGLVALDAILNSIQS